MEYYVEPLNRIVGRFYRDVTFDPLLLPLAQDGVWADPFCQMLATAMEDVAVIMDFERPGHPIAKAKYDSGMKKVRKMARDMVEQGLVDPAYCYALHRVNWCPRSVAIFLVFRPVC